MNIPRPLKLLVFVLTMWVPLYMVGFMVMIAGGGPSSIGGFETLFRLHTATMIVELLLLVFYVVHVFKARTIASDKRALWGIALFMGAPIAMPIYFALHVWPEPAPWGTDHVIK